MSRRCPPRRRIIALLLALLLAVIPAAAVLADETPPAEVELQALLASLGATCEWNPLESSGVIMLGDDRVSFQVDTPFVLVNWEERVRVDPPRRRDGAIWFTEAAVAAAAEAVERARAERPEPGQRIAAIMLDAGHGGKDAGGVGSYSRDGKAITIMDKDVALKVAILLGQLLRAGLPDKEVHFIRTTDVFVELEDRSKIANRLLEQTDGTVLYLSIHANTSYNRTATGYEVYWLPSTYRRTVFDPSSAPESDPEAFPVLNSMMEADIMQQSILLGQEILRGLDSTIGSLSPDRGSKEEQWAVVRSSRMPAVLVEVGYLSNPEEAARLADDAYLRRIAQGLYAGIQAFVARFERTAPMVTAEGGSDGAR